ncbi:MAG: DUF11 domain-containing protein [Planctomycetota bacterium]|nr:MAG: DUF11 domain-containing protein [Planctomycetota bacterium]
MNMHLGNLAGLLAAGLLAGTSLVGCTQQTTSASDDGSSQQAEPQSAAIWGHYRPRLAENEAASMMAFPTGEIGTSAILLHQVMPKTVRRGEEFNYSYHVTNLTNNDLQNVVVMLESQSNLSVSKSNPVGSDSSGGMSWALGTLGAGETKVIQVTGSADKVGTASECITVSYNNFLCATTTVVEPALALTKTAPAEVLKCDQIALRYVVKNTGSGPAPDVVITDTLPEGLALPNGSRDIRIAVGTLPAGESKGYEVLVNASGTGSFGSPAMAKASGDLKADASKVDTVVRAPKFEISSSCGDNQYLGRNFTHSYSVKNTGDGVANDTVASISIPNGTTVVRTSQGGEVQNGRVVWNFGSLAAGQSRDFSVTLAGPDARSYQTTATVNGSCAETVTDSCSTEIEGIPAILLEVIDVTDPVEVGQNTTYVITVTNQGSAPDRNVRVVATLPDQQSFVSATGATNVAANGKTITFSPVGTLGVGQQAAWRIVVKADAAGDVRFRIEMTSDNLTSPVIETEATNLYE